MTDTFRTHATTRSITLEARHIEELQETLDRLRLELAKQRAVGKRLVLAADADRRRIERDLHDGVQQHLIALAVNLQLARRLADADPGAAKTLLEEMARDVQQALVETTRLAGWIYPPLLDARGLAAALRAVAVSVGVSVSVEVAAGGSYPLEVAVSVYWCCLDVLEHAPAGARVTIAVRDEEESVAFDVVAEGPSSDPGLERLRDRVDALGGRLEIRSEPDGDTRVSGSLPLPQ